MIVPQFWAESRAHHPRGKAQGQFTVRRFGWSDTSQHEADEMARRRSAEALSALLQGDQTLLRREPKIPYNGAEGVPIREEVLARHGDHVITRNSYGAQCLNTPDVAFADIDFEAAPRLLRILVHAGLLAVVAVLISSWLRSGMVAFISALLVLVLCVPLALLTQRLGVAVGGGPLKSAMGRIHRFLQRHPDWRLRVYRTPAGLRVLVLHQTFSAGSAEIAEFFSGLGVDPLYAKMCRNQQCFRARLTPKPWRIGISHTLRPRPGVWPIKEEHLGKRQAWEREYERLSSSYAACEFLEELGNGGTHAKAAQVMALHDKISQALSARKIA